MTEQNKVDDSSKQEEYEFGVEVPQLMSMFVNSVYSSKDLFLREVVSNASDALTKIYEEMTSLSSEGYQTAFTSDLKIEIIPDTENKTLTIRDNGIGMTKADLKNYLGCIASSGTAKFREMLNNNSDKKKMEDLIGQFGLGFYSYFLVASKVDVLTKNPRDRAYLWSSEGKESYTIKEYDYDVPHGSSVILHLKDGEEEFLKTDCLSKLIKKHSMYVIYPISLRVEKEVEVDQKEDEAKEEDVNDQKDDNNEPEVSEVKKLKKKIYEMQIINSDISVWNKNLSEVPEEELKTFYKQTSGDYDDYAAVESFHFEGIVEVKLLLFIPKKAQMNFFDKPKGDKATNFKIYNNRVLITDSLPRDVVPEWMNFVVGAANSSDFKLNISREFLQGKSAMNILKNKLPKCISTMISNLKEDQKKFDAFYKEFSRNIKIAVRETTDNIQKTYADFLRYPTNRSSEMISLKEYCGLIGEDSKQILYLTGLTSKDTENSIFLDAFKDRHVLLMGDGSDEIMLQGFKTYNGLNFQNISAEGVNEEDGSSDSSYDDLRKHAQEVLKDTVEKVIVSSRFKTVPASILTTKYAHSSTMEAIIRSHPNSETDLMMQMFLKSKKIFELNSGNPFVKIIKSLYDSGNIKKTNEYLQFLYTATVVGCGFNVEDKTGFIRTLFNIVFENVKIDDSNEADDNKAIDDKADSNKTADEDDNIVQEL